MRLEYDLTNDLAYIYLHEGGIVQSTMPVFGPSGPHLNLDFDADGQLVGIEAIPATQLLHQTLLATKGLVLSLNVLDITVDALRGQVVKLEEANDALQLENAALKEQLSQGGLGGYPPESPSEDVREDKDDV